MPTWEEALGMGRKPDSEPDLVEMAAPASLAPNPLDEMRARLHGDMGAVLAARTYRGDGPEPPPEEKRLRYTEGGTELDVVRHPGGGWWWMRRYQPSTEITGSHGWPWDEVRRTAPGVFQVIESSVPDGPVEPVPVIPAELAEYPIRGPEPPPGVVRLNRFRHGQLDTNLQLARCPAGGWWLVDPHEILPADMEGWAWRNQSEGPEDVFRPVYPVLDPELDADRALLRSMALALPEDDAWYRVATDAAFDLPLWATNLGHEQWDTYVSAEPPEED